MVGKCGIVRVKSMALQAQVKCYKGLKS